MDKPLKMCEIFDCTLDELVTGDLTGRAAPGVPVACREVGGKSRWREPSFRPLIHIAAQKGKRLFGLLGHRTPPIKMIQAR